MMHDVIVPLGGRRFACGVVKIFGAKPVSPLSQTQAKRTAWQGSEQMPRAIRDALRGMNEDGVCVSVARRGKPPVRLSGRVDHAVETPTAPNTVILIATKRRNSARVLPKGVVPLSASAYMLPAQRRRVFSRA